MKWSTACPDWARRIVARESLLPIGPLFPAEGQAALDVFRSLRIADVPGKPRAGDVCRPWVTDYVAAIFGAYDPESGRQLVRESLLAVSKKNAKSTLAAGIMMTALIRNPRHSASFIILAPTKEIAGNSFDPASDMADAVNEELAAEGAAPIFRVYRRERRILHLGTRAELKIIAADSDTVGGTKATAVLVDELWLFGKKPGAMSMFREATGGLAARPEGFVIYLTTMSDEAPAGEFKSKLDYARRVRDGVVKDPAFLPVIYEFPEEMLKAEAHRDPANFYVTNPNLGASVDEEYLLREQVKAEGEGDHALKDFEAKHLNVPMGLHLASSRWAGAAFWESRGDAGLTLDALLDRSDVVVAGIDGGGLDDLLGLAILGRERDTRRWLLWNRAWAHEGVLDRRKSEAPRLRDLERAGDLVIVSDMAEANDELAHLVAQVHEAGLLAQVGMDLYGPADAVDALAQHGVAGDDLVVGIQQGWRLNGTIKTVENRLANGTLVHAGQDLMAWCVGNAKVEARGNAITITKQAAGTAKIDPLVATLCAGALMVRNPEARAKSFWAA
jgi:phage terminase large subunit-like protein